jgi:hypothetical protein
MSTEPMGCIPIPYLPPHLLNVAEALVESPQAELRGERPLFGVVS